MKKTLLIFVLAGFFCSANSQDNIELVDPGKMWSYIDYGIDPSPPLDTTYQFTYYHKFMDDTIIDQFTYLKVWKSGDVNFQSWTHKGYIRSEENGDVYYLNKFLNGGLIYKFDVQVEDTFSIVNSNNWAFQAEVISIDSVLIQPLNEFRKRIVITDVDNYGEEETWIEGVGSMAGVLNSGLHVFTLTGGYIDILCQWQNGTKVFSNPDFSYCFITTVSTPENPENKPALSIFPMPLENNSVIKMNKQLNDGRIVIVDMFGKTVKEITVSNVERISIQRDSFSPGIYIVSLYDGVRFVDRVKLMVR